MGKWRGDQAQDNFALITTGARDVPANGEKVLGPANVALRIVVVNE